MSKIKATTGKRREGDTDTLIFQLMLCCCLPAVHVMYALSHRKRHSLPKFLGSLASSLRLLECYDAIPKIFARQCVHVCLIAFLGPLVQLQLGRQTAGPTATNKRTKAMDHHLTRPYKRASSTLSTAERGGQRRESQSVGNNAGGATSTHVGDGSSRNPSSDHHHHHHHHASPARRAYPVAPPHSSSPYYGHDQYYSSSTNMHANNHHFVSYAPGHGTAEEFKSALRRR